MRELRPYQAQAIDLLKRSILAGQKRPVLQIATGGGKTLTAAHIVAGARAKRNRVCFTVPAIELIDQTVAAFHAEGLTDVGVIQADHPMTDYAKPVQVASVQTITRRGWPDVDVVIVDEAHRAHKAIFQWMDDCPDVPFIGLSATPWTRGLGKHYDDLIIAATTGELIGQGYLSPFKVFAPTHPDLSGVKTVAGDYHEGQLSEAMDQPHITADVVQNWLEHGENRPTLCFAVDRAHASSLAKRFTEAGVPTAYVDAYTPRPERDAIRKDFEAGHVKVVCNVGVLTTGVDWDVRCLILARPTKSEMLFTQIVGRALRTAPGKDDALIFDHTDTTLRLGFVTDIHHDRLCMGRMAETQAKPTERKKPLPKECTKCSYVKPAGQHKCPNCGFAPERQSEVVTLDGELLELDGRKKPKPKPADKKRFYAMLLGYAEMHGRSEKWALANFREKFNEWPHGKNSVEPITPDVTVTNWVRSRQIAYAKRMQKQRGQAHAA